MNTDRPGDAPENARPGLMPYDLEAPARLLYPVYSPVREGRPEVNKLQLGLDTPFTFKAIRYQGGRVEFQVSVPCDAAPHCRGCECEDTHFATLTEEQVTDLYRMLER